MSSTLYWEPANRKMKDLPDALKYVLQKKFSGSGIDTIMCDGDVPYLNGLKDAGVKGAEELIEAIEKYHEVRIAEIF